MRGKTDETEVPAGSLEREGWMFRVRKGAAAVRGLQEDLHTHVQYICTPIHAHTLHLVSIIEMGATCQLCPVPLSLTGNARGAGHAKCEVGLWPVVQDGPLVGTYQTQFHG